MNFVGFAQLSKSLAQLLEAARKRAILAIKFGAKAQFLVLMLRLTEPH